MNRVAKKLEPTESLQVQMLDPTISEGPRSEESAQAGYSLRASLPACLKPSTTMFVNLGMSLTPPAGKRFSVEISNNSRLRGCTMPLDSITTDMSGESGVLIRNNGKSNVDIERLETVAFLTVAKLPSRMQSLFQRAEDSRLAINTSTPKVMNEELRRTFPVTERGNGRSIRSEDKQSHAFAAASSPSCAESHLPSGALKSTPTKRLPKVSWFAGTKPAEEVQRKGKRTSSNWHDCHKGRSGMSKCRILPKASSEAAW